MTAPATIQNRKITLDQPAPSRHDTVSNTTAVRMKETFVASVGEPDEGEAL
jgi:hypothetical protein